MGQGEPQQSALAQHPPRLAINQHPGMDLHTHGGIVKRLGLGLRSCVGPTHNIALPHFMENILVSKQKHSQHLG